jgi:6-phosphofructokinase 1
MAKTSTKVFILEVMGRHAGWIALHAGLAGGADVILIPEIPFSVDAVVEKIRERERCGSKFSIVVVSEGAREVEGQEVYQDAGDSQGAPRLGGIGHQLEQRIGKLTGKDARCVVLGHLQRGGSPNAFDRVLATNFGSCAVRSLMRGEHGVMVALRASHIVPVPLVLAVRNVKKVRPDSQLIRTARDVGVSFGAPDEARHHAKPPGGL